MADKKSNIPLRIPQLTDQDVTRFWSKVDKSPGQGPHGECWIWKAKAHHRRGYGAFHLRDKVRKRDMTFKAPRIAYFIASGKDPFPLYICHTCDTPECCRPEHLFPGTAFDNLDDARRKSRRPTGEKHFSHTHPERLARGTNNGRYTKPERTARGEQHGNATITEETVRAIRTDRLTGMSQDAIARKYNTTQSIVSRILIGRTWAHVQ